MTDRRATLLKVHIRIEAGDPSASADLFSLIYRPLVSVLLKTYRGGSLSPEEASDLATDAVIEYLRSPEKYQPSSSSLFSYLAMIAKGDALNLLQARKRERTGIRRFVELSNLERNIENGDVERRLDADTILTRYAADLVDDEYDIEVLRLMLTGEKSTDAYAKAIGLGDASNEQKNAAVKQRRDKLEKRLQRLGDQL